MFGAAERGVGHEDLAGRRRLLEAGGDVDGVADERPEGAVAHDDLAGVDPGPRREPDAPAARDSSLSASSPDRRSVRSADGAERVVLVQHRDAEDRHHRVTGEGRHMTAVGGLRLARRGRKTAA